MHKYSHIVDFFGEMNTKIILLFVVCTSAGIGIGFSFANPAVAQTVNIGSTGGTPTITIEDLSASGEYAIRLNDGSGDFEVYDLKNSKTALIIKSSGKIGIGVDNPDQFLDVRRAATEPTILIQNEGSNGGAGFRYIDDASGADWKVKATQYGGFKIRDQTYGIDVITLPSDSGNVGIGYAEPDEKLDVNGAIAIVDGMSEPSTHAGKATIFVDTDGDLKIKFGDGTVKTIVTDD